MAKSNLMVKVVVFGNQQIAIDCIKLLKKHKNVQILAIVGCEKKGDKNYGYPSLKNFSKNNSFKFYQPAKLDQRFLRKFKKLKPDLAFSIYFRKLFKPDFINIPKMGFINLHSSPLPKYRGPAPTLWALLNDEQYGGFTIHYIDQGIDSGDIIAQTKFEIPHNITGYELNSLAIKKGYQLFKKNLKNILSSRNSRKKQNNKEVSYFGYFNPSIRNIDWFLPAKSIYNRIRALSPPYPGATAKIKGQKIIIASAKITRANITIPRGPGIILRTYSNGDFLVSTVDGSLKITSHHTITQNRADLKISSGDRFRI